MDKALKQRLVGASVLIALAVIVLPMLLSGRPQGSSQQSQKIDLPPRPDELSFETRRFPIDTPQGTPAPEAKRDDEPVNLPPPLASAEQVTQPETQVEQVTENKSNGLTVAAARVNEELTAPSDQETSIPDSSIDGSPAVDQIASAVQPVVSSSSSGRYVVQVASFGSAENASRLMTTLQTKNLPVLMDTIESELGKLNRVRVGPFANESDASTVSQQIGKEIEGVRPRVVDLQPEQTADAVVAADALVRWVVQAGSFAEPSNAETLVQQLRKDGLSAYSETLSTSSSSIHRVRIGPFLERDEAMRTKQLLADNLSIDGVVMSAE